MKKNQTVLIVDDEPLNRKILKKFLEEDYTIMEAADGGEVWEIIREKYDQISAVLLDIKMPVMDGYEVLAKVREAHLEELPIIVITSAIGDESEQRALNEGAWDFVTKPFNPKILKTRLNNSIARSKIAAYERKQYLSEHDDITGLYNRKKLFEETRVLLSEHPETDFIFIRIDIDHFALYNSSFGEKSGNKLLKFMADRIVSIASSCDYAVCGRMSADVFCLCASWEHRYEILKEKVQQLANSVAVYKKDYHLEISAGVCRIEDRSLSVDDYYFRANMAAQQCKNKYDVPLAFYEESDGIRLSLERQIVNEMQKALDEEQFVIYLQPKFNLSTDTACGAEALVRWLHPEKGLVSPGAFIPVFESNGFISKLDYYVWEKTCALLSDWLLKGKTPFPVSVNISRISLYNPNLPQLLTNLVRKYMISPSLLQLEITESAYMTNPDLMKQTIDELHKAGFTILMDDFGSGFSSLNTLKEIDMDVLKVDMKFLPVCQETGRAEIILASIIKMANWLGMHVIVEGVETRLQRDFLEGAGCECVQGFFFSRPIPSHEYEEKYIDNVSELPDGKNSLSDTEAQHNMIVLVIDDSEIDRGLLEENLKSLYNIQTCESAEKALAYLKHNKNKVRLMLVDNIMSGMTGIEFLRYCKQEEDLSVIPKIMITANDTVADQVEAFNEGAYDYITKPFVKEIVVARVKHVMEIICHTNLYD